MTLPNRHRIRTGNSGPDGLKPTTLPPRVTEALHNTQYLYEWMGRNILSHTLPPNLKTNCMTAVIFCSRHGGGSILDLVQNSHRTKSLAIYSKSAFFANTRRPAYDDIMLIEFGNKCMQNSDNFRKIK